MKLRVDISFDDKYTHETYNVGDVIEVGDGRGEELLSDPRKLVTLIEEVPKKETKKTSK